jgi:PleD family two-component response regulator
MLSIKLANSKMDKNLLAIFKILRFNSNLRFLVIDDQFYNIRGLQFIFQKLGIQVDGETSGEAALEKL